MKIDIPRPPGAAATRELIEARLADAEQAAGERLAVELRDQPHHLPVITVPISVLLYNPMTHRVRAQRDYFRVFDARITGNPWDTESQLLLASMLKAMPSDPHSADPSYARLKADLHQHGQSEPGIVTRDGVLVNGNTRRVALAELQGQEANMRVAVLPASADWTDIADIELALQMRNDHRREYSWVNRLIAIGEYNAQGTDAGVIAAKFRSTARMMTTELAIYHLILSLIKRSQVEGNQLPIVAFEDKAEHLRELMKVTAKITAHSADDADVVKELRIAAIMLRFSKSDVRHIDEEFFDRWVAKALPADLRATGDGAPVPIPGLGLTVSGPHGNLVTAQNLTNAVLRSLLPTGTRYDELRAMMGDALDRAGRRHGVRRRTEAAPNRLRIAAATLDETASDISQALGNRTFDPEQVDAAVGEVRKSLRMLGALLSRTPDHGQNVEWLLRMALRDEGQ